MELATNTFNKGIQLDTNPMVLGNDTLTDCLNGTLITMNGNEVILQNDMGNRRVDNAFLPPGYLPVGIKEYGGIIYIAAYNPITNRSLIGSFPSPERKINNLDDKNLGGDLDLANILNNVYSEKFNSIDKELTFIKNDTILLPITSDTSLHPGDKFVVYCKDLDENLITNFNNTYKNRVFSPKNRDYTLALGILNSQNLFVDITKTLVRWTLTDPSEIILYLDNVSELYKFNDGYFIAKSFGNDELKEAIEDVKLIKERQALPVNTYSYKLVGPMYLKAKLNHSENFDYNIYGTYDAEEKVADLYIDGYITYNCPDGISISKGDYLEFDDDIYYSYEEGILNENNFPGFLLYDNKSADGLHNHEIGGYTSNSSKYNSVYNTYQVKITKHYKVNPTNLNSTIYNYVLTVPALLTNAADKKYIRGLTIEGSIDLALLGSGTIELTGWRFRNTTSSTEIAYTFEAYPKVGHLFTNLYFTLTRVDTGASFNFPASGNNSGITINNGLNTLTIDWSQYSELEALCLYNVVIHYLDVSSEGVNSFEIEGYWILTTELFNNSYALGSSMFIKNYCFPQAGEEKARFDTLTTINIDFENSISPTTTETNEYNGKLFNIDTDPNPTTIKYSYTKNININLSINSSLKIKDSYLYPKYISLKDNIQVNTNIIDNNLSDLLSNITIVNDNGASEFDNLITWTSNSSGGTLKLKDLYICTGALNIVKKIKNCFISIKRALPIVIGHTREKSAYRGLYIESNNSSGGDDEHVLFLVLSNKEDGVVVDDQTWDNLPKGTVQDMQNGKRIALSRRKKDFAGTVVGIGNKYPPEVVNEGNYRSSSEEFYGFLSENTDSSIDCTWFFEGGEDSHYFEKVLNQVISNEDRKYLNKYAYLWWRINNDASGTWAICPKLILKGFRDADSVWTNVGSKVFDLEFYLGFFKEFEPTNFYYPVNNESYNNVYEGTFIINASASSSNGDYLKALPVNANLIFKASGDFSSNCRYELPIKSNLEFFDLVSNVKNEELKNVDIDHGLLNDSDGERLSINKMYIYNPSRGLEKITSIPFSIVPHNFYTYNGISCYNLRCNCDLELKIFNISDIHEPENSGGTLPPIGTWPVEPCSIEYPAMFNNASSDDSKTNAIIEKIYVIGK